jgi:hypothetical protein
VDDWYPMDSMRRANAAIELSWAGREFKATLTREPKTGQLRYCTMISGGEMMFLPPKGQERNWGDQPSAWRPATKTPWPDPLPAPLPSTSPRMWSSSMKFALVDEASASELAREMEENRRTAGAETVSRDRRDPIQVQWWRDASEIKYERRGEVTRRNLEGRLMRAVACSGAGLGLTIETRTVGKLLADLSTAADRAMIGDDPVTDYAPRLQPLPRDHDDFEEAMSWFAGLNPPEQRQANHAPWSPNRRQTVLILRALPIPFSFQEIGDYIGRKKQRAQQICSEAVDVCLMIANEPAGVPRAIEQLRERNRQHKMRA